MSYGRSTSSLPYRLFITTRYENRYVWESNRYEKTRHALLTRYLEGSAFSIMKEGWSIIETIREVSEDGRSRIDGEKVIEVDLIDLEREYAKYKNGHSARQYYAEKLIEIDNERSLVLSHSNGRK
jgi:hypothetical protein